MCAQGSVVCFLGLLFLYAPLFSIFKPDKCMHENKLLSLENDSSINSAVIYCLQTVYELLFFMMVALKDCLSECA